MPVITVEEAQQMLPRLNNRAGRFLIKRAMHLASLDRVNDLYDRNCQHQGADHSADQKQQQGKGDGRARSGAQNAIRFSFHVCSLPPGLVPKIEM